ncbi:MAG: AgmX/PglI C-terminal domain-containing protein [Polyangia bacterium]
MNATHILFAIGTCLSLGACASATSTPRDTENGPRPRIVRDDTQIVIDTGGVPPDKEAEIKLLLQERDSSARRCYQDVLNEKHTREFKGTVKVIITIDTAGHGKPRAAGGTLGNQEVADCLLGVLRDFEYPKLDKGGDVQYEYKFEPQY